MKYTVTVRATYVREMEVEADDELSARHLAVSQFEPDGDDLFSIDVFGLDPWSLIAEEGDPNAVDAYRDTMRGV